MRRFDLRSGEATAPTRDAERKSPWEWSLTMSVPERAILEMMDELPQQESFHQVDAVMEGMANLRPQLLGRLLAGMQKRESEEALSLVRRQAQALLVEASGSVCDRSRPRKASTGSRRPL